MHRGTAQHDTHTGDAGVHLGNDAGFFVGCPADHEDDDVLRLVAGVAHAFEEGELEFFEAALQEGLQGCFEAGGVLGVDVFDALEVQVAAELGEGAGGVVGEGEEVGEAGVAAGDGGGLEGVVVGEEFGDYGELGSGDGGDGCEEVEEDGEGVVRVPGVADGVEGDEAEFVGWWDGGVW